LSIVTCIIILLKRCISRLQVDSKNLSYTLKLFSQSLESTGHLWLQHSFWLFSIPLQPLYRQSISEVIIVIVNIWNLYEIHFIKSRRPKLFVWKIKRPMDKNLWYEKSKAHFYKTLFFLILIYSFVKSLQHGGINMNEILGLKTKIIRHTFKSSRKVNPLHWVIQDSYFCSASKFCYHAKIS